MNGKMTKNQSTSADKDEIRPGFFGWVRSIFGYGNSENTWRDSIDEIIDERDASDAPIDESEQALIKNVLSIRARTVSDVMVPRADIVAVEDNVSFEEILAIMTGKGHSRLPIFHDSLDEVIGMVHIKDMAVWWHRAEAFSLAETQRSILFVSPSMPVLELLLEMRVTRTHMAAVVDEYGGVDGLLTIEDLVEEIVGDIEDEHDGTDEPDFIARDDGTFEADARLEIEILEENFGTLLDDDEREDIDTLGGLVSSLSGYVPIRGELITHPAGLEFQVLDADPRRVNRLRIRMIATGKSPESEPGQSKPASPTSPIPSKTPEPPETPEIPETPQADKD